MVLHTPEAADEEKSLRDSLSEWEKKLETDLNKPVWTSGKWNSSAQEYQWFYGMGAGPESMNGKSFQRDKHVWQPEDRTVPVEGHECVAIEQSKIPRTLTLTKRDCNEQRHFICQSKII